MRKAPRTEEVLIDGPAGRLEGLYERPAAGEPTGAAVVCHPHPVHGGTLQNKVTHTLARAFLACGFATLRFNFRGVGKSEGAFDEGAGELADTVAATRWIADRQRGVPLWIAGFSFGAAIAIKAAGRNSADGLVSVAPAVTRVSGDSAPQPTCPWLVIQGEDDELVDPEETVAWINGLEPGPELLMFPETGHFFHGKLVPLREAVVDFVGRNR
jgi:alpha/beta superfamily hydrolase